MSLTHQVTGNNYLKLNVLTEPILFVDKSFNSKNISNYHLSLQIFLKGFSFCVLDRENNKFVALGHYYYEHLVSYKKLLEIIERIFSASELLTLPFQHVKVMFATPKFTFVPSAFFDNNKAGEIFEFSHKIAKFEHLFTNYIFSNSTYVIFAIPSFIKDWIENTLPTAKIYHQSIPLIEEVLLKNKSSLVSKSVYVNVYHSFFDVAFIEKGNLTLFNSFAYTSTTDYQYFILNVYDQLKLSSAEIPAIFSGFISKADPKIEQSKHFIKNISFLQKPSHFQYSFEFNGIEDHYFTNMINLYQCG